MPQGSIRIGDVEVVALLDVLTDAPGTFEEWFPGVPPDRHADVRAAHPETVASDGEGWRYFVRCYLVRTPGMTIVVDTGIGPAGTPVAEYIHAPGGWLPSELTDAGVADGDVNLVVITHMHFDHVGWNVAADGPRFGNAMYLVPRADWNAYADEEDGDGRDARDQQVRSLADAGVLDLVEAERALSTGVRLIPTPGHTPGSQSVLIEADGDRLLVAGDVANHPVQVEEPTWHSGGDGDPDAAARTRRQWFDALANEGGILATGHFPQPFGRIEASGGGLLWAPVG